jgi:hypothetical protein
MSGRLWQRNTEHEIRRQDGTGHGEWNTLFASKSRWNARLQTCGVWRGTSPKRQKFRYPWAHLLSRNAQTLSVEANIFFLFRQSTFSFSSTLKELSGTVNTEGASSDIQLLRICASWGADAGPALGAHPDALRNPIMANHVSVWPWCVSDKTSSTDELSIIL